MSVSAVTRRALHRTDDLGGMLALLEISHPSFSATIRVVNDTRDQTALGYTWLGVPFTIKLPNDASREMPRAELRLDNAGRDITSELEKLPPGAAMQGVLRLVHRSQPDVVDYEFASPIGSVRAVMGSVAAPMGPDDLMRRPAVGLRYDPFTAPSIFPD